jgi:hypothetical protein
MQLPLSQSRDSGSRRRSRSTLRAVLTVRPSTQEELDEREICLDAGHCLSAVNPAGGVIGAADAETHDALWISPQGDRNAVYKAIAAHKDSESKRPDEA